MESLDDGVQPVEFVSKAQIFSQADGFCMMPVLIPSKCKFCSGNSLDFRGLTCAPSLVRHKYLHVARPPLVFVRDAKEQRSPVSRTSWRTVGQMVVCTAKE